MTNRTRFLQVAVATAGLAALTACGSAPTAMAIAQACSAGADGSNVALEGYLASRSFMSCNDYDGTYRCSLDIEESPGGTTKAGVDIAVGGGADAMDEPPSDFTDSDLHVRADDSSPVVVGQKVRATGRLSVAPQVCFVTVEKLEHA